MFHEHKNTKLNHFSPISKVANFWVLQFSTWLIYKNHPVSCIYIPPSMKESIPRICASQKNFKFDYLYRKE